MIDLILKGFEAHIDEMNNEEKALVAKVKTEPLSMDDMMKMQEMTLKYPPPPQTKGRR